MISLKDQSDLRSESGLKIVKVHVKKNDAVKKGQVLITYDNEDARQQLLDEETRLKKQQLNREVLKEQFMEAQRSGDEEAIRRAKRDLDNDQLDFEMATRKINYLRKNLTEQSSLKAPFAGKVGAVNAEDGMRVPQGQAVFTLIKAGSPFEFSFQINEEEAGLLQVEETVPVTIQVQGGKPLRVDGVIKEIEATSGGDGSAMKGGMKEDQLQKKIVVAIAADNNLQGGEQASLQIEKKTAEQGLVIRKELLKKDGTGSYVFVVREKKSSLGNSYFVQKAYVTVGEEVGDECLILKGLRPQDDLIAETSEPLQEGNRIRIR
ncbi:efflux RND transporter periplasmic adaptor subunit [Paenibacillus radicis (ex Gao et al. 2016)]|uniref:RND transporter n=1 Tax=Paenibacillus radicis (ex Gao et al. 2016) TaxID=1737354 RepID=A0A917HQ81_9BACL|nr:efflux RND transporter periplasmic adaptor subunit [Paenibacillus radicis (ex Gao et al. 2016)]GGG85899.1 RND transporter [Paenibacillus radicis (ex Gao et al. 2016)]